MLLTFTINKQLIRRTDCEIPVAKSENYLYAQFTFSDEWIGTKTAIFNNGTPYSVILDEDNKCLVPWEVITASGFSVSVFCGQRITANVEFVRVLPTGYVEGQTPEPPTPSVYDQIIEELNSKQDELIAGENITIDGNVISASGGGGGTSDYSRLTNKPSINSVELNGNKSLADLGIQPSGSYATSTDLTAEATARQNADSALQTAINGKADAFSVDDTTIADNNGTLKVKDGGIGAVQLSSAVTALIAGKQDALVSGTNIKTINGNSLLGSGDLPISGGSTYTAGQNISIDSNNVISAGIEVIEL